MEVALRANAPSIWPMGFSGHWEGWGEHRAAKQTPCRTKTLKMFLLAYPLLP